MSTHILTSAALPFLKRLKKNNNREWFAENKGEFKGIQTEVKTFYSDLMEELNTHDEVEKLKMFRIYRDVRFSHDKTPYQPHFAGSFSRSGAKLRGGYYLRIRPGESFMAVGFWQPEKEDLLRIRKEFELDPKEFRSVINATAFKKAWGDLQGEELKTAPKGFDKEDPNIDLIRKKAFVFTHDFTDAEVLSATFFKEVSTRFKTVRPFFDLMSGILTTNLNGESLLD
ncbi:hypothetical protein MNBD_BACTEROID03-2119 [hydrothermal vent metagenome]|uniref:TIGR02453 family protein n=1 Tax=hydrothermal vent metagenome TaxID=652676 RepID=A0A3B0SZK8_9ZZZZ